MFPGRNACPGSLLGTAVVYFALLAGATTIRGEDGRAIRMDGAMILDRDTWIDANRIELVVTNHGSYAYDIPYGNAGLVYPAGGGNTAMFAGALWIGGFVGGELRVTLSDYSWEWVPGVLREDGTWPDPLAERFRVYKITAVSGPGDPDYDEWPSSDGAPTEPDGRPLLIGAQTLFSTYHDGDPSAHQNDGGLTAPLEVEVHHLTYAFDVPALPLSQAVFHEWQIFPRGEATIADAVMALWADVDLGGSGDDFGGTLADLDVIYTYNATNQDLQYGSRPPATALVLLDAPSAPAGAIHYGNGEDPGSAQESYNYMQGLERDGSERIDPTTGLPSHFWYDGDPRGGDGEWRDTEPGDKRFALGLAPVDLTRGASVTVRAAVYIGHGADRIESALLLRPGVRSLRDLEAEHAFPLPGRWAVAGCYPDTVRQASPVSAFVLAPVGGEVRVWVEDSNRTIVRHLVVDEWLERGIHPVTWDGALEDGGPAPAGDYAFGLAADVPGTPNHALVIDKEAFSVLAPGFAGSNGSGRLRDARLRGRVLAGERVEIAFDEQDPLDVQGSVRIHTTGGRLVWESRGSLPMVWDGRERKGHPVAAGVYLLGFDAPGVRAVGKVLLLGRER